MEPGQSVQLQLIHFLHSFVKTLYVTKHIYLAQLSSRTCNSLWYRIVLSKFL